MTRWTRSVAALLLVKDFGILDLTRTGVVALPRN